MYTLSYYPPEGDDQGLPPLGDIEREGNTRSSGEWPFSSHEELPVAYPDLVLAVIPLFLLIAVGVGLVVAYPMWMVLPLGITPAILVILDATLRNPPISPDRNDGAPSQRHTLLFQILHLS